MFRYCTALKTLTLPQSLKTVNRSAFIDSSFDQVYFEGKTLAQVKAMVNYDRWGLAEDKIYTNAFENQLPTKTSDLTNDSGYISSVPDTYRTYADTLSSLSSDGYATASQLDSAISGKADLSAIPTKTSELSNDSEYVTAPELSAQLAVKRDITDMRARGVPQNNNSESWFSISDGTTTENARYYDEGRWESG